MTPSPLAPQVSSSLAALFRKRPKLVVIGASAGAVDALGVLLPRLPANFPAVVAVVVHVPADKPSLLASLFGERCALPVAEAEDKAPMDEGRLYFAPPGYHLLTERDWHFSLSVDEPQQFSRPAIDALFESAAWAFGEKVLGIVLTGASADGARGLKRIGEVGGLCWVQEPKTAYVAAMPHAARAAVPESTTLTLEEMAEVLIAWARPSARRDA